MGKYLEIIEADKQSIPSSGKFIACMIPIHGNELTWAICEWCNADPDDENTYGLHSFGAFGYVSEIRYINPDTIMLWMKMPCRYSFSDGKVILINEHVKEM